MSTCPTIPTDAPTVSSAAAKTVGAIPVMAGKPFRLRTLDGTLVWDGATLYIEPALRLADGTYTQFSVIGGQIVEVGQAKQPGYTPGL